MLLSKGNKFAPIPKRNVSELELNLDGFYRRLRLQDYFHDSDDKDGYSICYNKSDFLPSKGLNVDLDHVIQLMENQSKSVISNTQGGRKYNMTKRESDALIVLRNMTHLHFTTADKGGALVILQYDFYSNRMKQEHLSDTSTYQKVTLYNCQSTLNEIFSFCKQNNTCLTSTEIKYLTKFHPRLPYMYGLPKLHKEMNYFSDMVPDKYGCISKSAPLDLKFRPIISAIYLMKF